MTDRIANKIYETKNYDKFAPFKGNRGSKKQHMNKLAKSMEQYGWIDSMPITCTRNGDGTLHMLDGHNRLYAAKILGIPVKYVVVGGELTKDSLQAVQSINLTQRSWSQMDHITCFANMGFGHYEIAAAFIERHKLGVNIALALLAGKPNISSTELASGTFEVVDLDKAEHLADLITQAQVVLRRSFRVNFIRMFIRLAGLKDLSADHLAKQMMKYPQLVIDYNSNEDISKMFEDIYNYNRKAKYRKPVAFMLMQSLI